MGNHRLIFNYNGFYPFQGETLNTLKVPREQVVTCNHRFHLKASRLVIPSLAGYTGRMPRWACNFLREAFLPEANYPKVKGHERIYISRKNARSRKVLNEDKVIELLTRHGFKTVELELFPVSEQVRLFSNAEAIVSAHGGGLTNLVFCQPGTKVLECFSPNYVNVLYWILSSHINLNYHYLIGEGERPPGDTDPFMVWDNITFNLDQLEYMLKIMGL